MLSEAERSQAMALPAALFDYELPEDHIAQVPLEQRDASRLLQLARDNSVSDHRFTELPSLLEPGDLLVANDTRVRAARLLGRRDDGGPAEVLLLTHLGGTRYTALVRPGRRLREGAHVVVGTALSVAVAGPAPGHPGARVVNLEVAGDDVEGAIASLGHTPLPPYIRTPLADPGRYQTVYAQGPAASAAAPTAGLHFTTAVRRALTERGVGWATVQLEVGLGTFAPITGPDIEQHRMHAERCTLPPATIDAIAATRRSRGRVIAVGTTVVRVLESRAGAGGHLEPGTATTDLFITPGHRFAVVDGLLTNFHQPRSSLLVLLAAFCGHSGWRRAYEHALATGYRFLSFGDCMLCWRAKDIA